ncbi:hypothetical protein EWH99_10820 [Sporolactobacillus sp. THM7-7]|nr:hypothetical protein EWH99_10820 [Sporolactobacillus sp. THM7-7]
MNHDYQVPYLTHRNPYHNPHHLKYRVLKTVDPIVRYGLKEAKFTSYPHALQQVAAITYLMGKGYNPWTARQIVESWEVDEAF